MNKQNEEIWDILTDKLLAPEARMNKLAARENIASQTGMIAGATITLFIMIILLTGYWVINRPKPITSLPPIDHIQKQADSIYWIPEEEPVKRNDSL